MNWRCFDKPEYFFRPAALWRRLRRPSGRLPGQVIVRLPFGLPLQVDRQERVGRAILTQGVYDLVLSETLWRLAEPGATASMPGPTSDAPPRIRYCGRRRALAALPRRPSGPRISS